MSGDAGQRRERSQGAEQDVCWRSEAPACLSYSAQKHDSRHGSEVNVQVKMELKVNVVVFFGIPLLELMPKVFLKCLQSSNKTLETFAAAISPCTMYDDNRFNSIHCFSP